MKDLKGMCAKCPKRDECTELCKKAEKYASQDYVYMREGLTDLIIENKSEGIDWNSVSLDKPEILKKVIIGLHLDGKSLREIAKYVPSTFQYASQVIEEYYKNIKSVK